jgi:outer membrane protein OmpA-like peptidoglycan-associated protein/opacity protein-like surface antigen
MNISKQVLLALALLAAPAMAAERSGFYIGGDVGQANWNLSEDEASALTEALADEIDSFGGVDVTSTSFGFNDDDMTYSVFVGYQFVPWLALEASWMDLGQMDVTSRGDYIYNEPEEGGPTGGTYDVTTAFESDGWAASALLMLPFMETWNVFGRLGYYWGDNELRVSGNATDSDGEFPILEGGLDQSDDAGAFMWGAGLSYTWSQRLTFRVEYTNITDVVDGGGDNPSDMERYTFGMAYRFGDVAEPMAPMVAAAPVAAAAAPTQCADADNDGVCDADDRCPNTPAGDRVGPRGCSCDVTIRTHFAFDSAELTAQDIAELERVAGRLKELEFVGGTATGHTDSVGDEAYNQKLSERRAQAVVDFLHAQGVSPSRITAIGMGETKPIADNATEEGRAQNRRVTIRRTDCGPAN